MPMMRPAPNHRGHAHGKKPQTAQQGQNTGGATPVPQSPGNTEKRQGQLSPRSLPVHRLGGFGPSGGLKTQASESVIRSATVDAFETGACITPSFPSSLSPSQWMARG